MKPFNQRDILIKCPFLRNLPIEAMDKVYEVIENVLVPLYAEEGEVDDDIFEEHLGHILGPPARGSSLAEDRIPVVYGDWCKKNKNTSILRFKKRLIILILVVVIKLFGMKMGLIPMTRKTLAKI
jgi:hypothetical protein